MTQELNNETIRKYYLTGLAHGFLLSLLLRLFN